MLSMTAKSNVSDGTRRGPVRPEGVIQPSMIDNHNAPAAMKTLFILIVLATSPVSAMADSFTERCEKLASEAKIQVIFEDKQVVRDDNRSLDALKRLSNSRPSPYHHVLGLTHAEPFTRMELTARTLDDTDGRVCTVPSLTLRLGFSNLQVYLANELKDPCRRRIVEAHEQEHVAVWRDHFRIGARLLTSQFQKALGQPLYFDGQAPAKAGLQQRVEGLVNPPLQGLMNGINAAHQQIDAPGSYQLEENRMRACP